MHNMARAPTRPGSKACSRVVRFEVHVLLLAGLEARQSVQQQIPFASRIKKRKVHKSRALCVVANWSWPSSAPAPPPPRAGARRGLPVRGRAG